MQFARGAQEQPALQLEVPGVERQRLRRPPLGECAPGTGAGEHPPAQAAATGSAAAVTDRPISFEVFADDFCQMERQARKIAAWAENVFVKIPVTNTRRQSSMELAGRLAHSGVKINVTAVLTLEQVRDAVAVLAGGARSLVSVFAGRIADLVLIPVTASGVDLVATRAAVELIQKAAPCLGAPKRGSDRPRDAYFYESDPER